VLEHTPQLVTFLHGHTAPVTALSFEPGGVLASGGRDGDRSIRFWNWKLNKAIGAPIRAEKFRVEALAFRRDGEVLASIGDGRTVKLWSKAGSKIAELPETEGDDSLAFGEAGILACAGGWGKIRLWDIESKHPLTSAIQAHPKMVFWKNGDRSNSIPSLVYSPNGKELVSGALDGTIRRWNGQNLKQIGVPIVTHSGDMEGISSLAFSPDGETLASAGGDDGKIQFWNAHSWQPNGVSLQLHQKHIKLAFAPDGTLASSGMDGIMHFWMAKTWKELGAPIETHQGSIWSLAYCGDRTFVSGGGDGTIMRWKVEAQSPLGILLHAHAENGVLFCRDGTLVTAGEDGTVRFLDGRTGQEIRHSFRIQPKPYSDIAISAKGIIASAARDGTIQLWDAGTGKAVGVTLRCKPESLQRLKFTPAGDRLVAGDFTGGAFQIWDVETGKRITLPIQAEEGDNGYIWDLAFSSDGETLASAGLNGIIRLWDGRTGRPLCSPKQAGKMGLMTFIAFAPNGALISAGNKVVTLWDGRNLDQKSAPIFAGENVGGVAFSPDGEVFAYGERNGDLQLWDSRTMQLIGSLTGGPPVIRRLSFSYDNTVLVSGYDNGDIVLWDVNLRSWRARAQQLANRELTQQERQRFLPTQ
jgi:WD40 repeat protein